MGREDDPTAPDTAAAAGDRRVYAMALMVFSAVLISFGGLVSRYIEAADAWQINIHRPLSISALVAVVLLMKYRGGAMQQVARIGVPGWVGAGMLTLTGVAFIQAITSTTVANTLFTMSSIPFLVAGLAWVFLRETLNRVTLIAMIVAAGGVGVMIADGLGAGDTYGNLMALLAAFGFAGYAIIVRRHRTVEMMPVLLLSGIMLAALSLIANGGDWRISWWDFWMCCIWGAALSGVGNILFLVATRHLLAAEVTLFLLLEFSLAPIWVWLGVGETPTQWTLAGGALVLTAVLARTLYEIRVSRRRVARGRIGPP